MKRVHMAWLQRQQISAGVWCALRSGTEIWSMVGELARRRHEPDQREHVRRALGLLRRAWLAHCAGREELSRGLLADARLEQLHAATAPLAVKAGEAWLAEQGRVFEGKLAHRGKPEQLTAEINKAIEANPTASNREIAKLARTSEASVRRRRKEI